MSQAELFRFVDACIVANLCHNNIVTLDIVVYQAILARVWQNIAAVIFSMDRQVNFDYCACWVAVHWIYSTGSVSGQGAARPYGGQAAPLVPRATLLLAPTQGEAMCMHTAPSLPISHYVFLRFHAVTPRMVCILLLDAVALSNLLAFCLQTSHESACINAVVL